MGYPSYRTVLCDRLCPVGGHSSAPGQKKDFLSNTPKAGPGGFCIGFWMRTLHDIDLFGVLTQITLDTRTSTVECLCLLVLSNDEGMVV